MSKRLLLSKVYSSKMEQDRHIGQQIGNYRLVEHLDCGSYGCVYRAEHLISYIGAEIQSFWLAEGYRKFCRLRMEKGSS